jgi:hypothetical protein
MSRRRSKVMMLLPPLLIASLLAVTGCGAAPTRHATPLVAGSVSPTGSPPQSGGAAGAAAPSTAPVIPATAEPRQPGYTMPVQGRASYERTHHDYPATDVMAPCGAIAVAVTDGVILEVNRVDTWNPKVDAGPTRGGLSISLLGVDGVRYYGSHFASIQPGIEAGTRVAMGEPIAKVGRTGDAGACHIHFGISPSCAGIGDWWTRRGVIWPWPYLDAWQAHEPKIPADEVTAWKATHGCPTAAATEP